MHTFVLYLAHSKIILLKLFLVCCYSFTLILLLCCLRKKCSECSFAKAPLSSKSPCRIGNSYRLMSQRDYSWPPSSISTASTYTIYSRGSWATPTLGAFANSSLKLTLITSYKMLAKRSMAEWEQGRCIKTWLLTKSPESKYRQSVFYVVNFILKLLCLPLTLLLIFL